MSKLSVDGIIAPPPCSRCGHPMSQHRYDIRAPHRGKCINDCACSGFKPKTDRPKPVNGTIGRMLYKRK